MEGDFIVRYIGESDDSFTTGEIYTVDDFINKDRFSFWDKEKSEYLNPYRYNFEFIIEEFYSYTPHYGYLQIPIVKTTPIYLTGYKNRKYGIIPMGCINIFQTQENYKIENYPETQYVNCADISIGMV